MSMISGFSSPGEPLSIDLNIPDYFEIIRDMETFRNILFLEFWKLWKSKTFVLCTRFGKDGHRQMMRIRLKNLGHLGYESNIYQKTWYGYLVIIKKQGGSCTFIHLEFHTFKTWHVGTFKILSRSIFYFSEFKWNGFIWEVFWGNL